MAQEGLTKVTNATNHSHPSDISARMADDTVRASCHAFGLTTACAGGGLGDAAAEVAEGSVLLGPLAEVAGHEEVAGVLAQVHLELLLGDGLLPSLLLLGLLARSSFPLRHISPFSAAASSFPSSFACSD